MAMPAKTFLATAFIAAGMALQGCVATTAVGVVGSAVGTTAKVAGTAVGATANAVGGVGKAVTGGRL